MKRAHLLDRLIGEELPEFRTDTELRAFESTPYAERVAAQSTYEALQLGAAHDPAAPAIHFLQRCEPDETPLTISHAQLLEKITQTANLLADLGVGPRDVVSFMLPLLPQSFFTLYGAEAAGIANPAERGTIAPGARRRAANNARDCCRRQIQNALATTTRAIAIAATPAGPAGLRRAPTTAHSAVNSPNAVVRPPTPMPAAPAAAAGELPNSRCRPTPTDRPWRQRRTTPPGFST
jgi:acyl-CoA synthetase (AMP-forming)/AMP-acid ligase II